MMNYLIVVDDAGEMKSVSAAEIGHWPCLASAIQEKLNEVLDRRAIEAGEYDPSDNDTPFEVVVTGGEE